MVTGGGFTMFIGGSGHVEAKRKRIIISVRHGFFIICYKSK
jgi:hypothetical protein